MNDPVHERESVSTLEFRYEQFKSASTLEFRYEQFKKLV